VLYKVQRLALVVLLPPGQTGRQVLGYIVALVRLA
jgi:hypothetical protein